MTSMRESHDAVVWVADDEVFAGCDYGVRLVERLTARGLRVLAEDLTCAGQDRIRRAALHIISGGGTSVSDLSGWMPGGLAVTRALVEGARADEHTLVGVCLGAQMIAETLRPGSVRGAERIKTGLADVTWHPPGRVDPVQLVVPVFHYEEINRRALDAETEVVGEDANAGVQAVRFRPRVWGLQFHPEMEPDDVRRLVGHHRHTIERHHQRAAVALRSVDDRESRWRREVFDEVLDDILAAG